MISATGVGAALGWLYVKYAAIYSLIPAWVGQLTVTLIISCATLTATHFLKRELNRRWPDRNRPADSTNAAKESQENNDAKT